MLKPDLTFYKIGRQIKKQGLISLQNDNPYLFLLQLICIIILLKYANFTFAKWYQKQQINNLNIASSLQNYQQMSQQTKKVDNDKTQQFLKLRQKYPQKIVQISMKAQVLMNWIQKNYFNQFQEIYKQILTQEEHTKQTKVLDQGGKVLTQDDRKQMVKQLLQAIKIVIQSVQVHEQKKFRYDLEDVQKMVQDIKKTFKQLNEAQKQKQTKNKSKSKKQTKHISVLRSNDSLLKKNNMLNAPQKQKPIPENGIFVRKNSGVINDMQIGQNPFAVQQQNQTNEEVKSNRSKRSNRKDTDLNNQDEASVQGEDKNRQNFNEGGNSNDQENNQNSQQITNNNRNDDEGLDQNQAKIQQTKALNRQDYSYNNTPLQLPPINKIQPQYKYTPYQSNSNPSKQKSKLQTIRTNPYVKKVYGHICKQSYIGGGTTFDQIAQSSDIMSLNKWMVFCKQFNYVEKLKKKQLIDIYHQVTDFTNKMTVQQFLNGIILLQNKLKVDQQDFLNYMGVNSQFSFRQKVGQFKIRYSGAQHNFFEQATKLPVDKHYQKLKSQKFKKDREKQKQFILHQGKFRQQIIAELSQRKQFRSHNKSRVVNLNNQIKKDTEKVSQIASPYLKFIQNNRNISKYSQNMPNVQNPQNIQSSLKPQRKIEPMTYSDLFHNKSSSGNTTRAFSQSKKISNDSSMIENAIMKKSPQNNKKRVNLQKIAQIAKKSRIKGYQKTQPKGLKQQTQRQYDSAKVNLTSQKPQRQWIVQQDWSQYYKQSDSDESDQILKQHLNNEKMTSIIPNKLNLSRMMDQYKKEENAQDDAFDRETEGGDDNMITKVERFR